MGFSETVAGKLLLAAWGGSNGHVAKCITLARHAAQGGWQPVIVTYDNPVHLQLIEDAGFESIRYPPGTIPENWWHCWLDATYIRAAVDTDLQLIADTGANLVVHDVRPSMPVAADIARIGCGSICRQASLVGFEFPNPDDDLWRKGAPPFNAALDQLAQPRISNDMRELYLRGMTLIPSTPDLDPLPARFPSSRARYLGPLAATSFNRNSGNFPRAARRTTPGAFFYRTVGDNHLLDEFCEIFADMGDHVFVATGTEQSAELLRTRCSGTQFQIRSLWDINALRDQVDVAVHHGGHGTIFSCIENEIPAVVLPGENPDRSLYADRVSGLQIGVSLSYAGASDDTAWRGSVADTGRMPDWATIRAHMNRIAVDEDIRKHLKAMRGRLLEFNTKVINDALTETSARAYAA
jgi:UDP:flavonoid glycosyltransferase YjiC (YdhE family)